MLEPEFRDTQLDLGSLDIHFLRHAFEAKEYLTLFDALAFFSQHFGHAAGSGASESHPPDRDDGSLSLECGRLRLVGAQAQDENEQRQESSPGHGESLKERLKRSSPRLSAPARARNRGRFV